MDNVQITAGSGTTIAAKDRSSVYFQRMLAEQQVGQVCDEQGNALTVKVAKVRATASGNTDVIAAVTAKKLRVLGLLLQASGTVTVKFVDSAGSPVDLTQTVDFQAREGLVWSAPPGAWLFETSTTNVKIQVNLTASVGVTVHLVYVEV